MKHLHKILSNHFLALVMIAIFMMVVYCRSVRAVEQSMLNAHYAKYEKPEQDSGAYIAHRLADDSIIYLQKKILFTSDDVACSRIITFDNNNKQRLLELLLNSDGIAKVVSIPQVEKHAYHEYAISNNDSQVICHGDTNGLIGPLVLIALSEDSNISHELLSSAGINVPKSDSLEDYVEWATKAAQAGNPFAKYMVGRAIIESNVTDRDKMGEGADWISEAVKEGNGRAMGYLADLFLEGIYFEKNTEEAIAWYEHAAEEGDTHSSLKLGNIYNSGILVPKSTETALYWYAQALDFGDPRGGIEAARILQIGSDNIEQDYEAALEYLRDAADMNDSEAMYQIGLFYENGWGVAVSKEEALKWMLKASKKEHPEAAKWLEKNKIPSTDPGPSPP